MKRNFWCVMLMGLFVFAYQGSALAEPSVGDPAPDFDLTDTVGERHRLTDHIGDFIVLEWVNYDCPFVRKHYSSGNMQALQSKYTDQGVTWFSICSSAPGKQGYYEAGEWGKLIEERDASPSAVLLDPDGKVGRMYAAKTTPHMYVISPEGILVYQGAIDDIASADPQDIPKATNHVAAALDAAMAGGPVSVSKTRSYGCSVKY